jgi:hypothetical protein
MEILIFHTSLSQQARQQRADRSKSPEQGLIFFQISDQNRADKNWAHFKTMKFFNPINTGGDGVTARYPPPLADLSVISKGRYKTTPNFLTFTPTIPTFLW